MAFDIDNPDPSKLLKFNQDANFAMLDTPEGELWSNGLYLQMEEPFNGGFTGWNYFTPWEGQDHNDWVAGGSGSDTLFGDNADDLSCDDTGEPGKDPAEDLSTNDLLYGGSGYYLDRDDLQDYIDGRTPPEDDDIDSTQPPSFDHEILDINIADFDLNEIIPLPSGLFPNFDFSGDELVGGRGEDTVFGQAGNDTLDGGGGSDLMFGGRDNDLMDGDYLGEDNGFFGNEVEPTPGVFVNTLDLRQDGHECDEGDAGDTMFGGRGKDTMFGGDDSVSIPHSFLQTDSWIGSDGTLYTWQFGIWNFDGDWMRGGGGRDTMNGEAGFDTMYGNACNDLMMGSYHYDLMFGGRGSDVMYGGTTDADDGGEDTGDFFHSNDLNDDECFKRGYEGNDSLADLEVGTLTHRGGDTMFGGRGFDEMHGGAGDDLMYGGKHNDTMYGGDDDDRMLGQRGHDEMHGGDGWDDMSGGRGDDTMFGGEGSDYMEGNTGDDDMHGGGHNDVMNGMDGDDNMWGDSGNDTMTGGNGMDEMWGGEGHDAMHGGAQMDMMYGGDGDDCMEGDGGRDYMEGNDGDDTMDGGEGVDTLLGGEGNDDIYIYSNSEAPDAAVRPEIVNGGEGDDTFVYHASVNEDDGTAVGDSGYVVIEDFTKFEDTLQLCIDGEITECCTEIDVNHPNYGSFENVNERLIDSLSHIQGTNSQHGVRVYDWGENGTQIVFDNTLPEGQDPAEPEFHNDEYIWLEGVSGYFNGDGPYTSLWDLYEAGYRIEIAHESTEGLIDSPLIPCEWDCPTCDLDPFGEPDEQEPMAV